MPDFLFTVPFDGPERGVVRVQDAALRPQHVSSVDGQVRRCGSPGPGLPREYANNSRALDI
eukprot:15500484-Heterocapsa_arctica.AAC.1